MKVEERVAVTVEAARQQQIQKAKVTTQQQSHKSRTDLLIFLGILALALLSVVALGYKGVS